jgi:hypothetical protein
MRERSRDETRSTAGTKTRTTISSVATSRYWKSSIELKMRELLLAQGDDVWEAVDDVVSLRTLAAEPRGRVMRLRAGRSRASTASGARPLFAPFGALDDREAAETEQAHRPLSLRRRLG